MAAINPYLTLNGNCEEAFIFYQSVFGGNLNLMRFKDFPQACGDIPETAQNRVLHVSLPISKETILMGSDAHPLYPPVVMGQHLSISVIANSKEEADKIFNGLSVDGKVTMPMGNVFWGAYFGMLNDKFGITWLVSFG